MTTEIGIRSSPSPRKRRRRFTYIRAEAERIWPHVRRRPTRSGATGVHVALTIAKTRSAEDHSEHEDGRAGVQQQLRERRGAALDAGAEEVGGAGPEHPAGRHRIASVAPVGGPFHRRRPLRLHVRAGRPVEEGLLELAPAPLERDPRVRLGRSRRVARDRPHDRPELAVRSLRVVTSDAGLRGAAEIERRRVLVGVRAGGRVDDRVRAVDDLELVVAPVRTLGALVRAVADLGRSSSASAAAASGASKTSWIISQSPSCVLLKSLKG